MLVDNGGTVSDRRCIRISLMLMRCRLFFFVQFASPFPRPSAARQAVCIPCVFGRSVTGRQLLMTSSMLPGMAVCGPFTETILLRLWKGGLLGWLEECRLFGRPVEMQKICESQQPISVAQLAMAQNLVNVASRPGSISFSNEERSKAHTYSYIIAYFYGSLLQTPDLRVTLKAT